jgi:hypothetical protein
MKALKNIFTWIITQFRTHTLNSLLIAISAAALAAAGILWASGIFRSFEAFAYLPDRGYILAPTENTEPQTLEELLHVSLSEPDLDTLLHNPAIADELMEAEKLTDVVDSRLALNNLRSLDQQLSERLSQMQQFSGEEVKTIDLADRHAGMADNHFGSAGVAVGTAPSTANQDDTACGSSVQQAERPLSIMTAKALGTPAVISGMSGSLAGSAIDLSNLSSLSYNAAYSTAIQSAGEFSVLVQVLEQQKDHLKKLKNATEQLLKPKDYNADLEPIPPSVNMKAVWQSNSEALIHMTPSGDWLPQQGCKLYRKVGSKKVLIDGNVLSPAPGLSGELQIANADMIRLLFKQARLTPEKLDTLGMTAEEFNEKAYSVDSLDPKEKISGKLDFLAMRDALITIPASIEQKIPQTDLLFSSPILIHGNSLVSGSSFTVQKKFIWQKFTLNQIQPPTGIRDLEYMPDSAAKLKLARDIMSARQQISTLAFVDDEFAEKAKFLVRDDLSALNLSNGTRIQYIVEAPDGSQESVVITHGNEVNLSKPQGLMGYGIDGKVPLRWDGPQTEEERSIVSGYHIERKLDDESKFTKITKQPVAISYVLDEHDIYFESPVFFEDEVEDGRTAEYRIYSIDVFGRRSEYSDTVSVTVERVTPPNAPNIVKPELSSKQGTAIQQVGMQGPSSSTSASAGTSATTSAGMPSGSAVPSQSGVVNMPASVLEDAMKLNNYKPGVVLPIYTDTPDTVRFTIYRAKAIGAGIFGPPEILADIPYDNPRPPKPKPVSFKDEELFAQVSNVETMGTADSSDAMKSGTGNDEGFMAQTSNMQTMGASSASKTKKKKIKNGTHVVLAEYNPVHPDLIYFDAYVEKGCTYKYWVSAWDKWNNESSWSQSVTMGIPTDEEPEIPQEIDITMHLRRLPDRSAAPPGMVESSLVRYAKLPQPGAQTNMSDDIDWSYGGVEFPERAYPDGAVVGTVENALADRAQIGSFLSYGRVPKVIDAKYSNYPDRRYIHKFVGVMGEDLLPGGTAILRWPAYSGEGLGGYAVYRPLFTPKSLEEMQQMSYSQLVDMGRWQLVNEEVITQNQLMLSGLDQTPGKLSLFLICLEPEKKEQDAAEEETDPSLSGELPEGGHVILTWDKPGDPQVQYYRVYRSEVPSFKEPVDESKLQWTLIGDRIEHTRFTQRVDQSYAHYYYYKITSVSPWGVESTIGRVRRFRVPSTKPPETPNLLVPLSTKDGVKINFSAVQHCDRYEIWRTPIPVLSMDEIEEMAKTHPDLYEALFGSPDEDNEDFLNDYFDSLGSGEASNHSLSASLPFESRFSQSTPSFGPGFSQSTPSFESRFSQSALSINSDRSQSASLHFASGASGFAPISAVSDSQTAPQFMSIPLISGLLKQERFMPAASNPEPYKPSQVTTMIPASKIKTISKFTIGSVQKKLGTLSSEAKLAAFNKILNKYGPLAVADYSQLSWEMSKRINWEKIGELPADSSTTEAVDPVTGLLKPLSYTDTTAQYGIYYLYTVQAWNDDNLGSSRPEPVTATPRRNRPFDPIDGLQGEVIDGIPQLVWNIPKMKNVSPEKCLEDTVGYIVYRSDARDGTYYQASPLLFENRWADTEADKNAFNWYRVKVLDTGGYLSEFSEPILVQQGFVSGMATVTPQFVLPDIAADTPAYDLPDIVAVPKVSFDSGSYVIEEGMAFEAPYRLTGTGPITVTLRAINSNGAEVSDFTLNAAANKVTAPLYKLRAGTYNVTVTAKNSAGESSASFTLTVKLRTVQQPDDIPQLPSAEGKPPELSYRDDDYEFTMYISPFASNDFIVQLSASGTEPLTWSLEPYKDISIPSEVTIGNDGLLRVKGSIAKGTYMFFVRVSNDYGSDTESVFLAAEPLIKQTDPGKQDGPVIPYDPDKPRDPITPTDPDKIKDPITPNGPGKSDGPLIPNIPDKIKDPITPGGPGKSDDPVVPYDPDKPKLPVIKPTGSININRSMAPFSPASSLPSIIGAVTSPSGTPALQQYDYTSDNVRCMGFTLTDVKLNDEFDAYYGMAILKLGGTNVPVNIIRAEISQQSGFATMTHGSVFIEQSAELPDIGLTLVSLDISPHENRASVSGYIKSTNQGRNLAGDLYAIKFENAKLGPGSITISKNLPEIRYMQLKIYNTKEMVIDLNAAQNQGKNLLMLRGSDVSMKFHLETLRNEGLDFKPSTYLFFDTQGRMTCSIETTAEQCIQLLVPGGAGLRIREARLHIINGEFKSYGKLEGKLVIPFEKSTTQGPLVPGIYAGAHPAHSELDDLASGSGDLSQEHQEALNSSLVHFGEKVQQNSLLILPKSFELQDKCASVPISLNNWNGEGFVVTLSTMDNVRVTNKNLRDIDKLGDFEIGDYLQREQALIISGKNDQYPYMDVSVDLSRTESLPVAGNTQGQNGAADILTPKETGKPFWVGIVIKKAKLALPSKYLQQSDGNTIQFDLAEGEMIFDLNGFNYQTYLYGSDPEGVPARFGDNLGGFEDVRVKDCLLDLYANTVNLEINATVKVGILQNKKVEAKLYTDKRGEFICSVAPTDAALAKGINMKIDGGFFNKEGMSISGKLELPAEGFDAVSKDALGFTGLTIPSSLEAVTLGEAAKSTGAVVIDKPVTIDFKGFPMELREFDLRCRKKLVDIIQLEDDTNRYDSIQLTLRGATLLSDNIALSRGATDSLAVRCRFADPGTSPDEMPDPILLYNESGSRLNTSFDGCIDVTAKKLIPKKLPAGSQTGGLVEFETDGLDLNFLGASLKSLPVSAKTRFGKQTDGKFYYAVGLTPLNGKPINFGAGDIDNFTGLVAYNMAVSTDERGRYQFPGDPGLMDAYIDSLPVGGGKFAGGIKGEMSVIGLCAIKDLYFCFESGPSVTAEGDLYLPLSIQSIVKGKPDKFMGKAAISYRHQDRYLSFSMTLERINVVLAELGGSLGFEYSPSLFGVYLGYPETLAGNVGIFHVGAGVGFRYDWEKEAGMIQAKMEFGLEKSINIAIVYLKGYLYAGADGAYYWSPDGSSISLTLYLKGGIEGDVKVGGKRFQVIGFYLDAQGTLASSPGFDKWNLSCSASVSYCVDVFLFEVEGSVTADFATTIG